VSPKKPYTLKIDPELLEALREIKEREGVVSVKWWKSIQRVIVRPADYAARFTSSMS
jgi:hypothetical protein